jgi:hypothetical protein
MGERSCGEQANQRAGDPAGIDNYITQTHTGTEVLLACLLFNGPVQEGHRTRHAPSRVCA